jgi:hypothetical protein
MRSPSTTSTLKRTARCWDAESYERLAQRAETRETEQASKGNLCTPTRLLFDDKKTAGNFCTWERVLSPFRLHRSISCSRETSPCRARKTASAASTAAPAKMTGEPSQSIRQLRDPDLDLTFPRNSLAAHATASAIIGGTALPTCFSCCHSLPRKMKLSWNDCRRAASLTVIQRPCVGCIHSERSRCICARIV